MALGRGWVTAPLEQLFGQESNPQITVIDMAPILASLDAAGWPLTQAAMHRREIPSASAYGVKV